MLDFNKMNGLVPAIIQDAETAKVLMLGYMNQEAYDNFVQAYRISEHEDCDQDTLLIQVHPRGPVCHTGTDTCWGEVNSEPVLFLKELQQFIQKRHEEMPEGSYTTSLFQSGINKMAQKVGEEAVETIIEATNGTNERLIYEGSDLLYHLIVMLTAKGLSIEDLARELEERHKPNWTKH